MQNALNFIQDNNSISVQAEANNSLPVISCRYNIQVGTSIHDKRRVVV
jgi:hypothetical protein